MRGGWVASHTPTLWTIGCIVMLAMGGLTGILMNTRADRVLHDTYFVGSHLDFVLRLATVFGFFAVWYYLFPKITGYAYSNLLGKIHFWLLFIGVNIMLVPQLLLFARMVERFADAPDAFGSWNLVSRIGGYISAASTLVFFANMLLSLLRRWPAD